MAFSKKYLALSLALALAFAACHCEESLSEKIDRLLADSDHNDQDLLESEAVSTVTPVESPRPAAQPKPEAAKPRDLAKQVLELSTELIGWISAGSSIGVAVVVALIRCCIKWRREGARMGIQDLWAVFMAACFGRVQAPRGVIPLPAP